MVKTAKNQTETKDLSLFWQRALENRQPMQIAQTQNASAKSIDDKVDLQLKAANQKIVKFLQLGETDEDILLAQNNGKNIQAKLNIQRDRLQKLDIDPGLKQKLINRFTEHLESCIQLQSAGKLDDIELDTGVSALPQSVVDLIEGSSNTPQTQASKGQGETAGRVTSAKLGTFGAPGLSLLQPTAIS